jgi:hypothetical protein
MKKETILILTFSCIGLLGVGSYFFISDYKQKQAFNVDTYGHPQGEEGIQMSYQRRPVGSDEGSTFGGKRTKNNRKRHSKKNSKKK